LLDFLIREKNENGDAVKVTMNTNSINNHTQSNKGMCITPCNVELLAQKSDDFL
jgi:hypothetical protein